ncbi:MAG: hypothetical protein Q9171_001561 [Xanthocarpia ochracea]
MSDYVLDGLCAVVNFRDRCFDRTLDFKGALLFGCEDFLQEGEHVLTCICDWLIVKIFDSYWGYRAIPIIIRWITIRVPSLILSFPEHGRRLGFQLWQIAKLCWPQQLVTLLACDPVLGAAATVGILIHTMFCVGEGFCQESIWYIISSGLVEIGVAYKTRVRHILEEEEDKRANPSNGKGEPYDSNTRLEAKFIERQDRNEVLGGGSEGYKSLFDNFCKERKQEQEDFQKEREAFLVTIRDKDGTISRFVSEKSTKMQKNNAKIRGVEQTVYDLETKVQIPLGCPEHDEVITGLQKTVQILTNDVKAKNLEMEASDETWSTGIEKAVADLAKAQRSLKAANDVSTRLRDENKALKEQLRRSNAIARDVQRFSSKKGNVFNGRYTSQRSRALAGFARDELESEVEWLRWEVSNPWDLDNYHESWKNKILRGHLISESMNNSKLSAELDALRMQLLSSQDVRELTIMHEKEITRLETKYNKVKEELQEELKAARTELQALKDEAAKLPDRVHTLYNQRFPDGFDILPTASKGAQCGFYAVIESMKAMNAADPNRQQPVPTAAELQAAFQSPQVQQTVLDWSKALGSSDTQANAALRREGDFSIEEISLALDHWATTRNNLKLQIGYLRKNGSCKGKLQADGLWEEFLEQGYSSPQLVWCRHQEDPECTVIWLHHNGLGEDDAAAHYSGMRNHLPASQEQQQYQVALKFSKDSL